MEMPSKTIRTLACLAGLVVLSNCATTQETMQECRKAAFSYCDKTVKGKDAGAPGPGEGDASARNAAYQQCLDTQLAACGSP
jgi:hypothetical protein